MTTMKQIKAAVHADQISRQKDGTIIFRDGYFYRHGRTAEGFRTRIASALRLAGIAHEVIESGDHYATFRGSASLARSSHFFVQIRLTEAPKPRPALIDAMAAKAKAMTREEIVAELTGDALDDNDARRHAGQSPLKVLLEKEAEVAAQIDADTGWQETFNLAREIGCGEADAHAIATDLRGQPPR